MNNFEKPTSMDNLQDSNLLRANDRYSYECAINKSHESFKTQDTAIIQNIDILFQQIEQEGADIESLVMNIYSLSLDIELKPSLNKYFIDNFPFLHFLNIIFEPPSPECQSYGFVCLSTACQSPSFPYQSFANENVLTFLYQALSSEDPNIVESSLLLLTAITKKSVDSRDFLLQSDIISTLKPMKKYSVAELLESLCSSSPPPPAQFIPSITEFIISLFDSELPIFELALSSLLSLLTNNAEGIEADQFQNNLIVIFYSEYASLVPLALKIMMFTQNPFPQFPEILLNILLGEEYPNLCNSITVLLPIAQLFARFEPIWRPIVQDRPFELLKAKIGISNFKVDIEIIQTMILYYDNSHIDDMQFFNILLRFCDSIEISCKCMDQILLMIQSHPDPEIYEKLMCQLQQSEQTFVDLANKDDEDIAERAESILSQLEGAS